MITVSKLRYKIVVFTETGLQLDVTNAVDKASWEEGEDEIASKVSFNMYNTRYKGKLLSSLVKIGCRVGIIAEWGGGGNDIVAFATIKEALRETTKSAEIFNILAYDDLFDMQKSQDNIYFEEGKSTSSILSSIFSDWGLSVSKYTGPDVTHGKVLERNQYLGDIVRNVLAEAKKKGGGSGIVRMTKGKVEVVGIGTNEDVYHLEGTNTVSSRHKVSVCNMVTRVKIVSNSEDEGLPEVVAVVDGKTEYGILQRIVTQNESDAENAGDAQTEANTLLEENGDPEETSTVESPDVPPMRKGDFVSLDVGALQGIFVVKSIQHSCTNGKMTIQVRKYTPQDSPQEEEEQEEKKEYKVGDEVNFHGGTHYVSSWPDAQGYPASPGPARIFLGPDCAGNGGAHPWSLITTDWNQTNVYGWVDEGTFD